MRILVNFMRNDGWSVHCLAADCRTLISQWVTVRTDETLLRLLKASGANPEQMGEIIRDMNRWGRASTIPRSISPELLVKCVRKVAAGETWIDNQSVNRLIEAFRCQVTASSSPRTQPRLSPKDLAIINCITQGMRNKDIEHQLGTTEQVIKNYLRKVFDKLGVSDRIELAHYGLRHQLHKKASDPGFVRGASVPVPDIQSKPDGACRA
jgi:DNA-binding CsgD family transcriptional regulator